jgi:hypothetical protein
MNRLTEHEARLIEAIRALPRTMRPARDLWPGIDARLSDRGGQASAVSGAPGWRHAALAASVVLVFAAGLLLGRQFGPGRPAVEGPAPNLALRAALQASEMEYQAAFRQFTPIGTARGLLETPAIQSIENSWEELQQAEAALLAALAQHPENTYLNQRLLDLRAQQLAFMQQLTMLDRFNRRNT